MTNNKFYALLTGSKTSIQQKNERVLDRKTKKYRTEVKAVEVKQPTTLVVALEGRTILEARNEATAVAKQYGLPLQGVHSFKN